MGAQCLGGRLGTWTEISGGHSGWFIFYLAFGINHRKHKMHKTREGVMIGLCGVLPRSRDHPLPCDVC